MADKGIIVLEDGTWFEGYSVGVRGKAFGEICFNTSMTGYQEVFTDPSYYGQVVVMTHVHIGNYGIKSDESQSSDIKISGLIIHEKISSNTRYLSDGNLVEFLGNKGIVAISDVDTRAIVRRVRDIGAMNVVLCSDGTDIEQLKREVKKWPQMDGQELASIVSTMNNFELGDSSSNIRIAVMDYGVKSSILEEMVKRGAFLKVFSAETNFSEVETWKPSAYFLSNGPGDPAPMEYAVEFAKDIIKQEKPVFGICLGNQILGRAFGLSTEKMKFGHRGSNHPVKNVITGHCEITSQNHGFSLKMDELSRNEELELTHINLNDQSVEGFRHKTLPIFSVQYHPEASPGPHDAKYLFDQFFENIKNN